MQDTIIGGCDRMRYQDLFFEKDSLFLVTGGQASSDPIFARPSSVWVIG